MNISHPVTSIIGGVEFGFLSSEEIRAISVQRIQNDNTFDSLLNPVRGGLYDQALGSWGDLPCSTCHLNQAQCPGHPGHIELPVPVYHPVFMDQLLRLLRAQCIYCKGFRMRPAEIHRYICKLRLVQHGLLEEAEMIDIIGEELPDIDVSNIAIDAESEAEDENDPSTEPVIARRTRFVSRCFRKHQSQPSPSKREKHEGMMQKRREIVKEFLSECTKPSKCATCQGISPSYRKDRFTKIFEKALSSREKLKMKQKNLSVRDMMAVSRAPGKRARHGVEDEGIADVGSSSSEEEVVEDVDSDSSEILKDVEHLALKDVNDAPQRYISHLEVHARLTSLFEKEHDLLSLLYQSRPSNKSANGISANMFFINAVLVPPNRFRPEARTGNSQIAEAQQNALYKNILRNCERIALAHKALNGDDEDQDGNTQRLKPTMTYIHQVWTELQDSVNVLIDKTKSPAQGAAAKRAEEGIKQKLEKKEGLFRKNMMGKRVNFAARSVISPDPNIETNEIGVPPVFATKLTYPEPVTNHNFRELYQAVVNGTTKWPGAAAIENENGQIINLRSKSVDERVSLANQLLTPTGEGISGLKNKKVHRHLANGDVVLMNRQPTLHKPSIMGHRVRVLPGEKTIRMHYANCNTYNADFDGDEMNMHFPQNEVARAEALQIADTDHQYLSGTQGKPLRGLIQDHLSVSVSLCNKDTLFSRADYQQLVYSALRPESGQVLGDRIELVPPSIIRPVARWTGKQVITTILKNITPPHCGGLWMTGSTQIKKDAWGPCGLEDGTVFFQDGVFITGILDKSQLGPSSGGFIHSIHEVYGPAIAGKLLSSLGRLLTRYLSMRAFTCGMDDLRLTQEGEINRKQRLAVTPDVGLEVAAEYVNLADQKPNSSDPELLRRLEEAMRDDSKQEGLDVLVKTKTSEISSAVTKACLPAGLEKKFPHNHMQSMTTSGAKGGQVNANQISCNLGQQVLEGRRVPLMVSGKSLPCFSPFETDVRAGGYIVNRFLTGIRPQEYYFHHMAGREGLIDTAVKTSRSGYLQRCIIKGMEGLAVAYDMTVRDSDGSAIQFLYGEDGIDISRQKYLNEFRFVLQNMKSEASQLQISAMDSWQPTEHKSDVLKKMKNAIKHAGHRGRKSRDPVISLYNPCRTLFATSEKFFASMSDYLAKNPDSLVRDSATQISGITSKKTAELLLAAKFMRSLVEPGEAVGIVAGQSIGEPSTQMTLNTFHLAGHSAKNVTLGIPRLREILMTAASKISTPSMTLHLNPEHSHETGLLFAKSISVLPLSLVLDRTTVKERTGKGQAYSIAKLFDVTLSFFPREEYRREYAIEASDILDAVERKLLAHLLAAIKREVKGRLKHGSSSLPTIGTSVGVVEVASAAAEASRGDRDDEDDEDDATGAKQKANREEAVSYGPNDEADDTIQQQMEWESSSLVDENFEDEGIGRSPSPDAVDSQNKEEAASKRTSDTNRARRIIQQYPSVIAFESDESKGTRCSFTLEFDIDTPKLLMLSLLQDAIKRTVIQQIPGIGECIFAVEEKTDPMTGDTLKVPVIHTKGVNLRAVQKFGDYISPNNIITNDISAVLGEYGVEACRSAIIQELREVFQSHGITVDYRHLNLIADYMTRNGEFTPFNRIGLRGNVSPFTKMSFETTVSFLKDAILDGDWDDLSSPSSRIVMGRLGRVGTGCFDIVTKAPTIHSNGIIS